MAMKEIDAIDAELSKSMKENLSTKNESSSETDTAMKDVSKSSAELSEKDLPSPEPSQPPRKRKRTTKTAIFAPSIAHYVAYCDDDEDVSSIMKKFDAMESMRDSGEFSIDQQEQLAKKLKVEVPDVVRQAESQSMLSTMQMGYSLDDGVDSMIRLHGYYEEIWNYEPVVDGYERDLALKKLETTRRGGCQGQTCCSKSFGSIGFVAAENGKKLSRRKPQSSPSGPSRRFSSSPNTNKADQSGHQTGTPTDSQTSQPMQADQTDSQADQAKSPESKDSDQDKMSVEVSPSAATPKTAADPNNCSCRTRSVECDESCACSSLSNPCKNRAIQRGLKKVIGDDVIEVPLKGIDPFIRKRIFDTLPKKMSEKNKNFFIEQLVLPALRARCGAEDKDSSLIGAFEDVLQSCEESSRKLDIACMEARDASAAPDSETQSEDSSPPNSTKTDDVGIRDRWYYLKAAQHLYSVAESRVSDFLAYPKGIGVLVKPGKSFEAHEFLGEYVGELYPSWRWFEREATIKSVKKAVQENAPVLPEFYNMVLERHEDDPLGYDLVFVDPKKKGNYCSRFSHSCDPNAMVTVVASEGLYTIAVYTLRKISEGDEITFDYFCRTDSKDEAREAICLCGTKDCRGSFLFFSDEDSDQILHRDHSFFRRIVLIVNCDQEQTISDSEREILNKFKIKESLLNGLPIWGQKFAASVCQFIDHESKTLPDELYKLRVKSHSGSSISNRSRSGMSPEPLDLNDIKRNSDEETEIVRNKRIQTLAITLDKIKYFLRHKGQPQHSPLRVLSTVEVIERLWTSSNSLARILRKCIAPHLNATMKEKLRKILNENLPDSSDFDRLAYVRRCLITIRDFLRNLTPTKGASHFAAADIIHLFAYTTIFLEKRQYIPFKSAYAEVGVCADGSGRGVVEHCSYTSDYLWSQLDSWFLETTQSKLTRFYNLHRGSLILPDIDSCYSAEYDGVLKTPYSEYHRQSVLDSLSQKSNWPQSLHFKYKNKVNLIGSPALDDAFRKGNSEQCFTDLLSWSPFGYSTYSTREN
uniref:Histone-lysine N-methyltransferase ATXR3 n=2 Tax=Hirondellea gigas TaxID=1518452 RepID=A0A6A7FXM5_9CRUS